MDWKSTNQSHPHLSQAVKGNPKSYTCYFLLLVLVDLKFFFGLVIFHRLLISAVDGHEAHGTSFHSNSADP